MPLASLPVNATGYKDTSGNTSDIKYYRVRAVRDTASSMYSIVALAITGEVYPMGNSTVTSCNLTFQDAGGFGNYSGGNYTTTIRPSTPGNNLKITFKEFNVNSYDQLIIYNGPSAMSPPIGSYGGTQKPPVLLSTAPGGELTFVFNSYYSRGAPGWTASVTCYKTVNAPTALVTKWDNRNGLQLNWTDDATDETGYTIERSMNDSFNFKTLTRLPANSTSYRDTSAPENSYLFYRVKAFRDSVSSPYSISASVINGETSVMQNGTVSLCNSVFLDPGGLGNYSRGNYTTTIRPSIAGNSLQVTFGRFYINSGDALYVYNGPSASSPLLGSFPSWNAPRTLKSTAPGGELTFVFNAYSNDYPGWVANISCYKPVLRPTGVKAIMQASKHTQLSWTDNADDETSFVIERSANAETLFKPIGRVGANETFFTDSTPPSNSVIYYRVRAYRDTASSLYSDTSTIVIGNAPLSMKDSVLVTCDKIFLDPGGEDIMPSFTSYNYKTTFKPAVPGSRVRVTFTNIKLSSTLYVYNGSSTGSPFIGSLASYNSNSPITFEGTGPEGSLTFFFNSYTYSNNDSGWVAHVSCYKPVAKPTVVKATINGSQRIEVNWNDNSDDETGFAVERSVNGASQFKFVGLTASNTTNYVDSTAPANSLIYYRIKAVRDTASSYYSDTSKIDFGSAPFLMKDSTLISCDKVFMDPDGAGIIPNSYYNHTVIFKPAIVGNNIRVAFSKFKISGYFTIYNGSSTSSPLIGTYNYMSSSPGTINGTGPEGSLTFVYQGYPDSGWVAQVSCYKPVAKPSGLMAMEDEAKHVKLTWIDNADNETKYVVERAINEKSNFTTLGEVPENGTVFIDSSAPKGSFLNYRVRGYRDTLPSFYSDVSSFVLGELPFIMKDSTVITCDKIFMDPGGSDIIPRNNNNSYYLTATIKPGTAGKNIMAAFSKFHLYGILNVYDGPSVNSPFIGSYNSYSRRPSVIKATGPDGSLTFLYYGYAQSDSGWVAQLSCYKPVAKPTAVKATLAGVNKVKITWTDNADDETKYVVERSVNAPSLFAVVADLPSNATNFTDSAAPDNSLIFYRVRAYRDTLGSIYSDTSKITVGNAPFVMDDTTLISCDRVFLDPGGIDVVSKNDEYYYKRTTFKPADSGNKIRVTFGKFRISGTLTVYDGASNSDREIGNFRGDYPYPLVFNATGNDGSLTFMYSGYRDRDSGWIAQVSCYKPVAKPTELKVVSQTEQQVKLTWTDNADDETKYVVQRSVNGYSFFTSISQLPANANQFTDNAPPANSYVHYRVIAYRDTLSSLPGDTASVALGNTPFFMKDSTLITCNKVFMDPGGADVIPPNSSYNIQTTFKADGSGNSLKAIFRKINLDYFEYLKVYDGPSTSSPLLADLTFRRIDAPIVFKSSGSDGSLTFVYRGSSYRDSGWLAEIICFKPVAAPNNLTIDTTSRNKPKLNWTDNANNEAGYIVERSTSDSFHYQPIVKLAANVTSYTDTAAPGNSFMYYRVAAYIDTSNSDYSNAVSVVTGDPFIMGNTNITTCGIVFLDPGGLGNYNNGYYTATVKPGTPGNVVRVQFSEFAIDGSLYIYNGPSTSSPLLGSFYSYSLPGLLQSSAPGGELTFVFKPYYSGYNPGWIAYLSCYKPVL